MPRFPRLILIALLFSCSPARLFSAPSASSPEWAADRIVAVGDLHGDFNQFVKCLRAAHVVDDNLDWIAGKTHLVQTGDVLDRGPDSKRCLDLLMKLEAQSRAVGGMVHPLLGNHEVMVLLGDWTALTPEEIASFGGPAELRAALGPDGKYGRWLRSHDAVIKINDTLFLHAGLTPALAGKSLTEINDAIRSDLQKSNHQGLANDPDGPLWDRSLALDPEEEVAKSLDVVLKAFSARHMVIGHTVDRTGIVTRDHGRLIRIDVGMTRVFGGPAACLVIDHGIFYEARSSVTLGFLLGLLFLLALGGIVLGAGAFRPKGIHISAQKYLTGWPAKIIGMCCLLLGASAALLLLYSVLAMLPIPWLPRAGHLQLKPAISPLLLGLLPAFLLAVLFFLARRLRPCRPAIF